MRATTFWILAGIAALTLADAVQAKKPDSSIPVDVTLPDSGGASGYKLQSDGLGLYQDGVDGVEASIGGAGRKGGRLTMRTLYSEPVRRVFVDFTDCAGASIDDCVPPFLSNSVKATVIVRVRSVEGGLQGLEPGESASGALRVLLFLDDGSAYALDFDPTGTGVEECAASTTVTVARDPVDAGVWTVDGANGLGCLSRLGTKGRENPFSGLYRIPVYLLAEAQ